jgi:RNA polymerase sigma-70 factor (ECF subfamily)
MRAINVTTTNQPAAYPRATPPSPPQGFARLERFWDEHSETVFRAAYRVTGNPADAEDVLQTVFLRLARRFGGGQPGTAEMPEIRENEAGAYLKRSAVNAALDIVRSRQRAGWVPLEPAILNAERGVGSGAGIDGFISTGSNPARDQADSELRANLRLAMARLSPRSAEIFALRYFEELSNREIAVLMGISQGLVAVLLHRTRARLRKELARLDAASSDQGADR